MRWQEGTLTPLVKWIYQPVSDSIMDHFGKSCYFLAGQSAIATALTMSAAVIAGDLDGTPSFILILVPIFAVIMYLRWKEASDLDHKFWRSPGTLPYRNIGLDMSMQMMWLTFIAWIIFKLIFRIESYWHWVSDIFFLLYGISFMSIDCFLSCQPRPPRRKEAKLPQGSVPT